MARTRSKGGPSTTTTSSTSTSSSTSKFNLSAESENPPKLFILPKKAKPEARVVSLLNPRYPKPTRYLVCPKTGTYEFVKISAPNTTPTSWLIEGTSTSNKTNDAEASTQTQTFEAHVTQGADLYVATPIDPMFLVLSTLSAQLSSAKRLFLSSDDHFDSVADEAPHMSEILRCSHTRKLLESRMGAVCDTVEAGDEHMYRVNEEKVLNQVLSKARAMGEKGLPASMEEKFVKKALEAPISSVKRENPVSGTAGSITESGAATPMTESAESQSTISTVDSSTSQVSEASTAATSVADESDALNTADVRSAIQASPEIIKLQRLRVAFNFICSNYVPPKLTETLKKLLAEGKGSVDFKPLDEYVKELTKLRQEATLARSASDYSRKRTRDEEDEDRAEKRRKKEEEDKRKKASESRGVRDLKKVNTSGMMKLSAFFKKK